MDATYWIERWKEQRIGFHLDQYNQHLVNFWPQRAANNANVFVPLCGKSNDLTWLAEQQQKVIGIELSELAIKDFFADNQLSPCPCEAHEQLTFWQKDNIALYCGDFFHLPKTLLPPIDYVYDRAALIALPEKMRADYVQHLKTLLSPHTQVMLITLHYPQASKEGPPFSVTPEEVETLYGDHFTIELLASYTLNETRWEHLEFLKEHIFWMTPKLSK